MKNDYKVCEIKELKIPYSSKVRLEDLWAEVTDNFGEKHIASVIYRHPRGNVKLFTEHFEKYLSKKKIIDALNTVQLQVILISI